MQKAPKVPAETNIDNQEAQKIANLYGVLLKPGMIRYAGGWLADKLLVTLGPYGEGMAAGTFRRYQTTYEHPDKTGGFISANFTVSRRTSPPGDSSIRLGGILDSIPGASYMSVMVPAGKRTEKGEEIFKGEHFQIQKDDSTIGSTDTVVMQPPSLMIRNKKGMFEVLPYEGSDKAMLLGQTEPTNEPQTFDGPLSDLLKRIDKSTADTFSSLELISYYNPDAPNRPHYHPESPAS